MYLAYKENDYVKFRNGRHLLEPEFDKQDIDSEGSKTMPPPTLGRPDYEETQPKGRAMEENRIGQDVELTPEEIQAAMDIDETPPADFIPELLTPDLRTT